MSGNLPLIEKNQYDFFCPYKIWFEPICFQVLWRFAFSLPLQSEAGGRGGIRPTHGGECEIRTRDRVAPIDAFQASALDHYATSPP